MSPNRAHLIPSHRSRVNEAKDWLQANPVLGRCCLTWEEVESNTAKDTKFYYLPSSGCIQTCYAINLHTRH